MAFKQSGGFRGNDHKGGFGHSNGNGSRPSFGQKSFSGGNGGRDGRDRERAELFPATCSTCGKGCEVPFRPSGDRPIFCRDCFGDKRGATGGDYARKDSSERSFPKREFTPSAPAYAPKPAAAAADTRIDDLKHHMEAMHKKMDALTQLVGSFAATHAAPAVEIKKVAPAAGKTAVKAKVAPAPAVKKTVKKVVKSGKAKK